MSMNRAIIVGRLVADPDLRYTSNGTAVANFTVACNRYKKEGEEQQADFINCVTWRKPAENIANYQKKGNLIGVEGSIQTRSYDDNDGKRVYVTEVLAHNIQYLEPRSNSNNNNTQSNYNNDSAYDNSAAI